jgi:hypothetical protein
MIENTTRRASDSGEPIFADKCRVSGLIRDEPKRFEKKLRARTRMWRACFVPNAN